MERRVKERLVGAVILAALIVSIVPELLPGPPPPAAKKPPITPEPVRNITVDLGTRKAPETEPAADAAAASARPAETHTMAAPSAVPGALGATPGAAASAVPGAPGATPGAPSAAPGAAPGAAPNAARPLAPAHLETAAPAPTPAAAAKKAASAGGWAVQLGSFASRANADKLMHQLNAQGFMAYVVPGGSGAAARYRVRVGPMPDRGAAVQAAAKLKSLGHPASFVPPAP